MASYAPLEPTSLVQTGITAPSFDGTNASFLATSTFIYSLFFTAIVGAAFYRYVVAGTLRLQASEATIRQSNEIIKRVTLGLLGVFSLFLILFTVNKGLVTGDIGLSDLKLRGTGSSSPVVPGDGSAALPPGGAAGAPGTGSNALQQDSSIRSRLLARGISVNKNVCPTLEATGCTTVGGLPEATLSMLESLQTSCQTGFTITGGTEAGHKSHGPKLYPVDVRIGDSKLDTCISSFRQGPSVGAWCKRTFINFGYIFCDENSGEPHWHIYK